MSGLPCCSQAASARSICFDRQLFRGGSSGSWGSSWPADPTCRRPALYRYYQAHFGWAPPAKDTCANTFAFLNAGNDFAKTPLGQVDPERVYAIDYLLAEANQNLVSRWGHSMLRLVICAPGRPRVRWAGSASR